MSLETPFFSICIPTYEMHNYGANFLKFNFMAFKKQTFKDFNVIISDHSKDDEIEKICKEETELKIKYFKNTKDVGSSSSNLNNCLDKADGKWIKILFQDDFLYGKNALNDLKTFIDRNFDDYSENYDENGVLMDDGFGGWVVTNSEHTMDGVYLVNPFEARWSLDAIYKGHNTISSPSVLTFKNKFKNNLKFDTNLNWLMDIDYYYQLYLKYNEPKIMKSINVVNRVWHGSISAGVTQDKVDKELLYFQEKIKK
jgi:hypothetical protein